MQIMRFLDIAQHIHSTLGPGYSEAVYHNAFEVALREQGISYETERILPVKYLGKVIGNLRIDLLVDGDTIIELKAVRKLTEECVCQVQRYKEQLGVTSSGYLFNFGSSDLQFREV